MSPTCKDGHFTPDLSLVGEPCPHLVTINARVGKDIWGGYETVRRTVTCNKTLLATPEEQIIIRENEAQKQRLARQQEVAVKLKEQQAGATIRATRKAHDRSVSISSQSCRPTRRH
jgi:hypothetical protein